MEENDASVLKIDSEKFALALGDGGWIDFSNRPTLWRIMARLVDVYTTSPGTCVSLHDLIEATYPGEKMQLEAAVNRMHYSLSTLRKHGLRSILQRRNEGYRIPPGWKVDQVQKSGRFSVSMSGEESPKKTTNLVSFGDAFIGRDALLDKIVADGGLEGLTLLYGPGGAGKTRLAMEVGLRVLDDFSGGVWFCDLAATSTREEVEAAVARLLKVPLHHEDTHEQFCHALRAFGPTVLILDNMEQLSDFASALLEQWHREIPQLRILVTSRKLLHLTRGAHHFITSIDASAAKALFIERVRKIRVDFVLDESEEEVLALLVENLDRLPLAIELAAARGHVLSVTQIQDRLNDRFRLLRDHSSAKPDRQATMMATLDWSWELTSPVQRVVLAQCSVFCGGFSLEAAEAVLDLSELDDMHWPDEVIEELVTRCLIHRREPEPGVLRFALFDSVRDYAARKLNSTDGLPARKCGTAARHEIEARHRRYYANLGRHELLAQFDTHGLLANLYSRDLENLTHAVKTGVEVGDLSHSAKAWNAAYWSTYHLQGPYHQVAEKARRLAEHSGHDDQSRTMVLSTEAAALWRSGDLTRAALVAGRALELARNTGDEVMLAQAHRVLGRKACSSCQFEEAIAHHRQAKDIYSRLGLDKEVGHELGLFTLVYIEMADYVEAHVWLQQAIQIATDLGDLRNLALHRGNLALIYQKQGRAQDALRAYQRAVELNERVGDLRNLGMVMSNQATLLLIVEDKEGYRETTRRALEVCGRTGDFNVEGLLHGNLGLYNIEELRFAEAEEHLERAIHLLGEGKIQNHNILKASLAYVHAHQGDLVLGRKMLKEAREKLAEYPEALAHVYLRRFDIDVLDNDPEAALRALEDAERILETLNIATTTDLGQEVAKRRRQLFQS